MTHGALDGLRVAILATDGFEQSELLEPRKALDAAGAETNVVSEKTGVIRGWNMKDWGQSVRVDESLDDAKADYYDGLLLPGGVINADALRQQPRAIEFVKAMFAARKPVAVICHASWSLIESGNARGRRLTSWPSLKTDLMNAGAEWVDQEVVVDENLVTSRKPADIPAFTRELIQLLARAGAPAH